MAVKPTSERPGWRVTLRYRQTTIADEWFAHGAAITIGEAEDCSLVVPGLADSVSLVEDDSIRSVPGLEGSEGRFFVRAHPDVRIDVRRELVPHVSFASLRGSLLWRELLYGASLAGCLLALLALERPASGAEAGGEASDPDSRIARHMFNGPIAVAKPAWPEPVVVQPSVPEPKVEDPKVEDPKIEPPVLAEPKPDPQPKPEVAAVPDESGTPGEDGESSHSSDGKAQPTGDPNGNAAADPKRSCKNPEEQPRDHIDVVFAIDVSTTMGFVMDQLASEIEAVDAEVRKHDDDPRYGLVVFVDDVLVVNEGKPYAGIDALRQDFERWAAFTSSNRQLRSDEQNVDWPENSLDALHAAATEFEWRPADDTVRLVVHATDDSFGAKGDVLSGQIVRHSYRETVKALNQHQVRVASFGARVGGRCECIDVTHGLIGAYKGLPSIPDATGGASFDIDEVAVGRLAFADVIADAAKNTVCREYSLPWQ